MFLLGKLKLLKAKDVQDEFQSLDDGDIAARAARWVRDNNSG